MDKIFQNLVWAAKQHHQAVSRVKRVVLVAHVTSRRVKKTHGPSRGMVPVLESGLEKAPFGLDIILYQQGIASAHGETCTSFGGSSKCVVTVWGGVPIAEVITG